MSDPLFDGHGSDAELERLEAALRPLRYRGSLPAALGEQDASPAAAPGLLVRLLATAALVLVGVGLVLGQRAEHGWALEALAGQPRLGGRSLEGGVLMPGQWLETGEAGRARLQVADIGELTLEPRSRLRRVETGPDQHRLELQRGRFHALVVAPPRLFVVDTPSARAVDLGCEYVLDIDDDGAGGLEVRLGFVALERSGREVIVPMGARCEIRRSGPGTPHRGDARSEFLDSLRALDFEGGDYETLCKLLSNARPADGLTLWHLLADREHDARWRATVHDRLAGLVEAPAGVTREAVIAQDPDALRAWQERLGLAW